MEEKLKEMKPEPLTQGEKNIMWSKIERHINAKKTSKKSIPSPFFASFQSFTYKIVIIPIILVLIMGGGTLAAADSAKPGDLLFPIDLTVENVRLVFADNKNKAVLKLKFAEERFDEAKEILKIIEQNNEVTLHLALNNATSTTGNNRSATSTNATSTSRTNASSTNSQIQTVEDKKSKRATDNFLLAINYLEKTKKDLNDLGDIEEALAVGNIIAELNGLTEERLAKINNIHEIDNIKIKIKKDKIELASETKEWKIQLEKIKDEKEKIKDEIEKEKEQIKDEAKKIREEAKNEKERIREEAEKIREEAREERDRLRGDHEDEDEDSEDEDDHWWERDKKLKVCHNNHTISISKSALKAHLDHGDTEGRCNDDTPDTTLPILSNISSQAGTTTADVSWNTNENSNSKIWYSTTTPLSLATSLSAESSATSTSHNLHLSGLQASTTYYYIVVSGDEAGNTATSTEYSFITNALPPPPDTEAPIISSVTATSTTTTTEQVNWNTNEPSSSKVWYNNTTPLTISSTTPMTQSANLVASHSLDLTGLATSTTYYYIVVSGDEAGNTATSTEYSFTTPTE